MQMGTMVRRKSRVVTVIDTRDPSNFGDPPVSTYTHNHENVTALSTTKSEVVRRSGSAVVSENR